MKTEWTIINAGRREALRATLAGGFYILCTDKTLSRPPVARVPFVARLYDRRNKLIDYAAGEAYRSVRLDDAVALLWFSRN
jgi:hypothetical protein